MKPYLIIFGLSSFLLVGCDDANPNNTGNPDLAGQSAIDLATQNNSTDLATPPTGDLAVAVPCTCPSGFSCDATGQCVGGDPTMLMLDVRTIKVSGTVTINGAAPVVTAQCTPTTVEAVVHLVDAARGHSFDIPILCSSASAAFDAVVFPGDYTVTVTGDATLSQLPAAPFPLPTLSVSADRTGIALDVKMVSLDGTVTLNSLQPTVGQCDTQVTVELVPTGTTGSFFDLTTPCATPLAWSGKVYPGSYNVTILNVGDVTAANTAAFTVPAPLDATTDRHNVAFDVKTFNVGGPLTVDTKTPSMTDCTAIAGSQVTFTENKSGLSATVPSQCVTNVLSVAPFKLFAGEYTVTIFGDGSPLLQQQYPIRDKFQLSQNQTSEAFDVSTAKAKLFNVGGAITLNGALPVMNPSCSFRKASVVFEDSKKKTTSFDILCAAANTFTGMLPAETYDIYVFDSENGSDLLTPGFPAAKGVVISADKTNFAFDEKTVTVSGRVTLNGQDPATVGTCNTGSSQFEGTVHLVQKDGPAFDLPIPCSAGIFAWSGLVYPGSYTVSVDGHNGSSSLPDESYKLAAAVDSSAGASNVKIDVLTTNVAGKLTLNGMAPSTTTQCNANPSQHKATVTLFNIDQSVSFQLPVLCSSTDFSWNGVVFPGTYRISVSGAGGYSSLPKNTYLAVPKLKI